MTRPMTIAVRDAILAMLQDAWPYAPTTREVIEGMVTEGWYRHYTRVYPNLVALSKRGAISHWSPNTDDNPSRRARWAAQPYPERPSDLQDLEDAFSAPSYSKESP